MENSTTNFIVRCKSCPLRFSYCSSNKFFYSEDKSYGQPVDFSGTSNLKRHADHCDNLQAEQMGLKQAKITLKLPPKFNKGVFRAKLVSWVTHSHCPDLAIEDEDLVDVFVYLNPDAQPPSRCTLH